MIPESDVWRAAALLVKRHGADAAQAALRRADEQGHGGNVDGCKVWRQIARAVRNLERREPNEGESVN